MIGCAPRVLAGSGKLPGIKLLLLFFLGLLCLSGCVRPTQVERVPIYFVANPAFNLDAHVSEFEERYPQFDIHVTYWTLAKPVVFQAK